MNFKYIISEAKYGNVLLDNCKSLQTYMFTQILAEKLSKKNTVLFLGAGLSIGSGLAGWKDLVNPLASILTLNMPSRDVEITPFHMLNVMQQYENQYGRNALISYLRDKLDTTDIKPNEVHKLIASLPIQVIFTTNYDDLIERALRDFGKHTEIIVSETELPFWNEEYIKIIKLCGELSQPESLIVTSQDFNTLPIKKSRIIEHLRVLLESKTPLFLGYSLHDPFFNQIWDQIGFQHGVFQREGYVVLFDVDSFTEKDLNRRHLKVISLPANAGDKTVLLADWLKQLISSIDKSRIENQAAIPGFRNSFEYSVDQKLNAILQGQDELKNGLIAVYNRITVDEHTILERILRNVEDGRIEQSALIRTVESLRRWALNIQKVGLPLSPELITAINLMAKPKEDLGGIYHYLEANLPLVPGFLTYKLEIGGEHRVDLVTLWKEIKQILNV